METMNSTTNSEIKPKTKTKRWIKKLFIVLLIGIAFFIIAGFMVNWNWTSSGSNEWKLALDKDGVIIHTLKNPGSFLIKVKATKRIKTKLAAFVSLMQDIEAVSTDGVYDAKILDRVDSKLLYTFNRYAIPFPFTDREFVLKNQFTQNSETKEVIYDITAAPDKVPPYEGYVRITHFNNYWRLIPMENGEVEVEWFADMDLGGYVMNLLFNLTTVDGMHEQLFQVEEWVQQEKYQNASIDFIQELENEKNLAAQIE